MGVQAQFYGVRVRVSYYHPVTWQTDSTPEVASCGRIDAVFLRPGEKIVALSRDLFWLYRGDGWWTKRCGKRVVIRLDNELVIHGVVWDTMNRRYKRAVDVLFPVGVKPGWGLTYGKLYEWWEVR